MRAGPFDNVPTAKVGKASGLRGTGGSRATKELRTKSAEVPPPREKSSPFGGAALAVEHR